MLKIWPIQSQSQAATKLPVMHFMLYGILQNWRFSVAQSQRLIVQWVENKVWKLTVFKIQYNSYFYFGMQKKNDQCIIVYFWPKNLTSLPLFNIILNVEWIPTSISNKNMEWDIIEGWKLHFITLHVIRESSSKEKGLKCWCRTSRRTVSLLRYSLIRCYRRKQTFAVRQGWLTNGAVWYFRRFACWCWGRCWGAGQLFRSIWRRKTIVTVTRCRCAYAFNLSCWWTRTSFTLGSGRDGSTFILGFCQAVWNACFSIDIREWWVGQIVCNNWQI